MNNTRPVRISQHDRVRDQVLDLIRLAKSCIIDAEQQIRFASDDRDACHRCWNALAVVRLYAQAAAYLDAVKGLNLHTVFTPEIAADWETLNESILLEYTAWETRLGLLLIAEGVRENLTTGAQTDFRPIRLRK